MREVYLDLPLASFTGACSDCSLPNLFLIYTNLPSGTCLAFSLLYQCGFGLCDCVLGFRFLVSAVVVVDSIRK